MHVISPENQDTAVLDAAYAHFSSVGRRSAGSESAPLRPGDVDVPGSHKYVF